MSLPALRVPANGDDAFSLAECLSSPGTLALLDRLPDAFVALDRDWRFVFVNREAERLLRVGRESVVGRLVTDVFTGEQLGEFTPEVREGILAGAVARLEAYSPLLGCWAEGDFMLYVDGVAVMFRDVSARRESMERYRVLFRASPLPTWVYDVETLRFLAVNDAAVRLYGWSREEFLSMDILAIRPDTDRGELRRYVREMPEGFNQSQGRWCHRTRDGRELDVEITSHPIEFAGRRARLVHVADVSERNRAMQALHESEARFRTVVESIDEGLLITDRDDRIVYANSRVTEILGWTAEELVGRIGYELLVPPGERAAMRARLGRRASGVAERWQMQLLRKDGTRVWVEHSGLPFRDDAGTIVGTIGAFAEITERLRLEEELRQSQKMEAVGRLAGGIAHDFNNLLTAITNYSELLFAELEAESPLREDVREIRAAADRAGALTRQLLAFGRRQVLQPTTLAPNEVVAELERMLRRLLGPEIVFGVSLDPAAGHVSADRGQLEQVLMNLVVNARDAMPHGGTLTVETGAVRGDPGSAPGLPPGDYVRIAVRDSGCGMDEATQARVFEPFFTTKGPGEGTGLGLSTVYGIVAQSGGTVTIESAPARGTCMTILLPRVAAGAASPRRASGAVPAVTEAGALGTVLLADDEEAVRLAVARILRKAGYRVLVASSGSEALGAAEVYAEPIEILLTDLSMPGMSGRELAARIRAARAETRVVLMSGHAGDELARRTPGQEDDLIFLQKPFTLQTLLETLRGA
jgi:two-component system cell cycle sensor histidine kinase/response regulator CckA